MAGQKAGLPGTDSGPSPQQHHETWGDPRRFRGERLLPLWLAWGMETGPRHALPQAMRGEQPRWEQGEGAAERARERWGEGSRETQTKGGKGRGQQRSLDRKHGDPEEGKGEP